MWWLKSSLLLLVVSLVIDQTNSATAPTITERFNIISNGGCTSSMISDLNTAMTDVDTLLSSFLEVIAVSTTSTKARGPSAQDGVVARKLLTKYFGIQFVSVDSSKNQAPTSAYAAHWKQINAVATLMNAFMSNGVLQGPVQSKPSILCTGTSTGPSALWNKFGWSAQVFEVDPNAPNGFKGAVDDTGAPILIQDVIPRDKKALPWFLTPKIYYNVESAEYETDLCVAPEGSKALAITMQGAPKETHKVRSQTVELAETEPIVLFCPGLFDSATKMLSNVVGNEPEPYFGIQISTVIAEVSLTVFHEFLHLVTNWVSNTILDHTYDMEEILLLAQGSYVQKDRNGNVIKTFTSFDSTTNAQTYEYFIFAWWYYKQTWTYVRNSETITAPAATFYDGILVPWNNPDS